MPAPAVTRRLLGAALVLLILAAALPARAAVLLRDADLEHALGQIAAPVLSAAGLSPSSATTA